MNITNGKNMLDYTEQLIEVEKEKIKIQKDIQTVSEMKSKFEESLIELEQYKKEYQKLIKELKEIKFILLENRKEPFYIRLLHYIRKDGK